jgi:hypothetical protein
MQPEPVMYAQTVMGIQAKTKQTHAHNAPLDKNQDQKMIKMLENVLLVQATPIKTKLVNPLVQIEPYANPVNTLTMMVLPQPIGFVNHVQKDPNPPPPIKGLVMYVTVAPSIRMKPVRVPVKRFQTVQRVKESHTTLQVNPTRFVKIVMVTLLFRMWIVKQLRVKTPSHNVMQDSSLYNQQQQPRAHAKNVQVLRLLVHPIINKHLVPHMLHV